MNKQEFIKKYGEEKHKDWEAQKRQWRDANPRKIIAHSREANRKGGKRYEQKRLYRKGSIPHDKDLIREQHGKKWRVLYAIEHYKKGKGRQNDKSR